MFRLVGVLFLLLLNYQAAQAKVVPSITTREEDPSNPRRTLSNIVWGCISTTIICAWAAIHPNIPPREGPFKATVRRLELMFWTIVAPEILPCWAMNQLLAAITVKDVYNKRKVNEMKTDNGETPKIRRIWKTVKGWFSMYEIKEPALHEWTRTHGHFLIMGGFHVVEPPVDVPPSVEETNTDAEKGPGRSENKAAHVEQGRVMILTLELLEKLIAEDAEFKIPITEEEITDRSKGDALSKAIFILQSTWFILQCVGRLAQGLNLTQLELTTLALASLNGITFVLWWDKPLGAKSVVRVYLKRKLTDSERVAQGQGSMRSELIRMIDSYLTVIRGSEGLIRLPLVILFLLLSPIPAITLAFFSTLRDILESSNSFSPDDTHVPTFYVPKHRYSTWYHILLLIVLAAIFGSIHCSGWNFSFPTYPEQNLWRVASLAVTILPISILRIFFIADSIPSPLSFTFRAASMITLISVLVYVSARLILFGLALSLLRHLPPNTFIPMDWTKFYPHFL